MIGYLIGKNGKTIEKLKSDSKTFIQIQKVNEIKEENKDKREIMIEGNDVSVELALDKIEEILKNYKPSKPKALNRETFLIPNHAVAIV